MKSVRFARSKLLSDPLRPERIAKSQADTRFPKPLLVSFDLWGTLYTPRKPIAELYHQISSGEYGLPNTIESIEKRFPIAYRDMLRQYPNYGKTSTDIRTTKDWWAELIVRVYDLPHYSKDMRSQQFCDRLISSFASALEYQMFDDVIPVLEKLAANLIPVVAMSNSDDRVYPLLEDLGLGPFFARDNVHISYDSSHAKPDRKFFAAVARKYYAQARAADRDLTMGEFLERAWHVGDHYDEDFVGAVKAGWNGVLLDRAKTSVFMRTAGAPKCVSNDCFEGQAAESLDSDDMVMIANNRVCMSSLRELPRLFDL